MSLDDGLVGDILRDHGLAEPLWGDEHDVAGGAEEVKADGGLDEGAVNLGGPVPVVVGDGLEGPEMTSRQAPLEASTTALALLDVHDVLEHLRGSPTLLGRESDEVVELAGGALQSEGAETMLERGVTHGAPPPVRVWRGCRSRRGGGAGRPGLGREGRRRAGPR